MPTIKYKLQDGTSIKGATTVEGQNIGWGKQPLMYWANKMGHEGKTLKEARDTATIPGTITHELIENHLKGKINLIADALLIYNPEDVKKAEIAFKNFIQWTQQFKFEPIAIEPNLVSEKYKYGGTPDLIGYVLGKRAIIDWKTGKIYEDVFLQLAAYGMLWQENHPEEPIEEFHVLRIPKNEDIPSFHHSYWKNLPKEAWISFECALTLDRCQKVLKQLL